MKKPRLLQTGLLLSLLSLSRCLAGAEGLPTSEAAELRTEAYDVLSYGKFDGCGKLVFQELYQDGFPAEWHDTYVYYPRGQRVGLKLRRSITAINVFLAAEIRRPSTVRTFLKEYLRSFLVHNLSEEPDGTITQREVDSGLGSERSASAAQEARRKAGIRHYVCLPGPPQVVGNGWTLDVNVLTSQGAVEHWLIKGRVTPLHIDSFLCEPKEPPGTFEPLMLIR